MSQTASAKTAQLLTDVAKLAEAEGCFASVEVRDGMVWATAQDADACYRLEPEADGSLFVSWCSKDRYLSQSIETDLLYTKDSLDDLVDEELVELGWELGKLEPFKHYRDEAMYFTFRSKLPIGAEAIAAADAVKTLLAYELALNDRGDMAEGED